MPTFVAYPYVIADGSITPGQHASFLGKAHDPFFIGQDPNAADFRLPELSLPDNLTPDRLADRREMMRLIDEQSDLLEFSARARGIDATYAKAMNMLLSSGVKKAFDLSAEPDALRDRYGRTTYGQGCLLARRLVEAGAQFVNVYFSAPSAAARAAGTRTASTTSRCSRSSKTTCCRSPTRRCRRCWRIWTTAACWTRRWWCGWASSAGRRGSTSMAGRDHWPQCYTALLAGGGVKRGFVHGACDHTGAYPASDPVRPEDLSATMFHLLGIDPHTEVRDALNRPLPISPGDVIDGVLA